MRSLMIGCVLAGCAGCAGGAAEPDPVAQARAEGRTAMAIMADGFAARDRGDEPAARAAFVLARGVAEATEDARAEVVPGEALVMDPEAWSPDGRYAIFARGDGRGSKRDPGELTVVEAATGRTFRIDHATNPDFAPDGIHLVVRNTFEMTVIDLATGKPVLGPRMSRITPMFGPGGRLIWTDRIGDEDRIHMKALPNGRETVLRAPARRATAEQNYPPAIESVTFTGDRVLGVAVESGPAVWGTAATIHVWDPLRPDPLATVEGIANPEPFIDPEGRLAYMTGEQGAMRLELLDLAHPKAPAVRFSAKGPCGAAVTDDYHTFVHCTADRYMTIHAGKACIWDTGTGRLVTSVHDFGNDATCDRDSVSFSGGEPDAPGTVVMLATGKVFRDVMLDPSSIEPPSPQDSRAELQPNMVAVGHDVVSVETSASDLHVAPTEQFIAGLVDASADGGRARLWGRGGGLAYQAARPSIAIAVGFGPHGELFAAGADGRVWHLDGVRALRTTPPRPDCKVLDGEDTLPVRMLPDGRAAMFCHGEHRKLAIEGQAGFVADIVGYSWHLGIAVSTATASAAFLDYNGIHVYALPGGASHTLASEAFRIKTMAVSPRGDRVAVFGDDGVTLYDTAGNKLWTTKHELASDGMVFSPDGTMLAAPMSRWGRLTVFDAATGKQLDELDTYGTGIAFEPAGTRIAVPTTDGIVVRDVATRRDVARHKFTSVPDRFVDSIAWAPDGRIAAVTNGSITVWTGDVAPAMTIALAGDAAAILEGDGVRLIGDARPLVACRVGSAIYPFELCEDRIRL